MSSQTSLVYQDPDGDPRELSLDSKNDTTIGRHPQCTLSVNQPSVSRRHARLWQESGRWYVEDLSSSNGTYVNNRRIGERQELTEGDKLRCGDFQMSYVVEDHTREVGQLEPTPIKKAAPAPPRLVGSLSSRKPLTPDPEAANRLTIGVLGPSDEDALSSEISGSESVELVEATAEIASLRRQLEEGLATVKRIEVENRDLKSQCSTLTRQVAQAERSNDTAILEEKLDVARERSSALEEQVQALRAELDAQSAAIANNESDGDASEMAEAIGEVYRDLDDLTSDLRLKLKLAVGLLDDLNPVIQAMERVRQESLPNPLQDIVRDAVDGSDAAATMKATMDTFAQAERSARLLRRMIRLLRDALRENGWDDGQ